MRRVFAVVAAATIVLLVSGCSALRSDDVADDVRIWDVHHARYVSSAVLTAQVIAARYRLLGEVHDNPAHHALRAQMLRSIAAAGRHPAVVFEQFDVENEPRLVDAQRRGADAEALALAGALDRASWDWPLHKPLLDAAVDAHLPVRAGNISRARLQAVARSNDVSTVDTRVRTVLETAQWNARRERALDDEIEKGHCGKLPVSVIPRIALAQRLRDAALATALMDDATADGAVLIAGNGHVRADLGVPLYLGALAREAISVGWVEVSADEARQGDAGRTAAKEHPGFDYLWLTDTVHRPDPCATIPPNDNSKKAS